MRDEKYKPFGVVTILDRQVGGVANLLSQQLETESLFKLSEFRES